MEVSLCLLASKGVSSITCTGGTPAKVERVLGSILEGVGPSTETRSEGQGSGWRATERADVMLGSQAPASLPLRRGNERCNGRKSTFVIVGGFEGIALGIQPHHHHP